MSTEVKHGPAPQFQASLTGGSFSCQVTGYYTATPDLAAAGVQLHRFASDRPAKQMAELLALRTAFLEWFKETYQELGGSEEEAIGQAAFIVDGWRKKDGMSARLTEDQDKGLRACNELMRRGTKAMEDQDYQKACAYFLAVLAQTRINDIRATMLLENEVRGIP